MRIKPFDCKEFELQRVGYTLTRTTSRTKVTFPRRTTTWCTSRIPYPKQWQVQQQELQWTKVGIIGEWTNYPCQNCGKCRFKRQHFLLVEQRIPCRPKPIRTISGFFGINWHSIFVVAENFFARFKFLVCSKFNHMQRDCTCACAVACLHPHNSISNVVVSVTIDSWWHIHIQIYLPEM